MRILFANHHLNSRAGSELYSLELASALRRAGHQVAVFTFESGLVSEEMARRGVTVFLPGDVARIEAFDPEILHIHHAPCLYFLGALQVRGTGVFSSLGVTPPLEAAPLCWEGVAHGLAVSEEVEAVLRRSRFGAAAPLSVFRNWFDDTAMQPLSPEVPGEARRIAVVTNHLDETLARDLETIRTAHPEMTWTHLGLPENSVEITPELLRGFDRVITIGRTVLLAAALQRPCLVYDVHGCDGLLTAERLESLASVNFSGRFTRSRPSREELEHLLFEEARQVDVARLAERVWREYSLSRRVEELSALYARVRQSGVALGEQSRSAYGREGQVHAEATAGRLQAQALLRQQEHALREAQSRQARIERLLAEVRTQAQERSAEVEANAAELKRLRDSLEAERSRSSNLDRELEAIQRSLAWMAVGWVRRLKDQFVAVPDTRRRQLYDQVLNRLKNRIVGSG
ncbi:glycosyltransferase family 4 protein [Hyalangium versicolor]|uniref:glycosyltransferase family 4 protein n=1 Tax=Hyalangium versicolor TaxID=2861190 RepID=UPI001CCC0289|nr:glycosyltransferase family 4 protein [Hyalangium versicolor]